MNTKQLGDFGELIAVEYLKSRNYLILEEKYKVKIGEIDIIAKERDTLVFIEVKARRSLAFGRPAEAVNIHKQHKIIQTAQFYLNQTGQQDCVCRFDVLEVYMSNEVPEIRQIEDAFEMGN